MQRSPNICSSGFVRNPVPSPALGLIRDDSSWPAQAVYARQLFSRAFGRIDLSTAVSAVQVAMRAITRFRFLHGFARHPIVVSVQVVVGVVQGVA